MNLFHDGEPNWREFAGERRELGKQKIGSDRGNDPNADSATDGSLAFDDIPAGGFEFTKNRTGPRKKRFAQFCEADGAAEAVEQSRAEFVYGLEDLLGK